MSADSEKSFYGSKAQSLYFDAYFNKKICSIETAKLDCIM